MKKKTPSKRSRATVIVDDRRDSENVRGEMKTRGRRAMIAALATMAMMILRADAEDVDVDDDGDAKVANDERPLGVDDVNDEPTLHTVFSTECNNYFDWQSVALYNSWRRVGQKGKFTRLMACDETPAPGKDVIPDTHVHKNYAKHPVSGDLYSAYNKPASVAHWLKYGKVTSDFIIVLDADMIFRTAMTASLLGVKLGSPVSARYSYLKGTLPENHMGVKARVPNVEKAQQVGGFTVMHREDLTRLAPRWLYWTEQVRLDPDSWANTGDIFNDNGKSGPPWISEMYGYVFAAAEVGIQFQVHDDFMIYPGYAPPPEPFPIVLHYGLTFNVRDWAFSKSWYHNFDVTTCPGKMFERPPEPNELKSIGSARRREEIALHCAWGLYNGTRDWSRDRCGIANLEDPPRTHYKCGTQPNGVLVCKPVSSADETFRDGDVECKDHNDSCCDWAATGECANNPGFMLATCPLSCNECGNMRCVGRCCPPEAAKKHELAATVVHADANKEDKTVLKTVKAAEAAVKPVVHDLVDELTKDVEPKEAAVIKTGRTVIDEQHKNQEPVHSIEFYLTRPRITDPPNLASMIYDFKESIKESFPFRTVFIALAVFVVAIRIRAARRRARRRRASKTTARS